MCWLCMLSVIGIRMSAIGLDFIAAFRKIDVRISDRLFGAYFRFGTGLQGLLANRVRQLLQKPVYSLI